MIKNLIFDFGKVLVDYDFEAFIRRQFDNIEEAKEFAHHFMAQGFMDTCDREEKPFAEIINDVKDEYPQFAPQLQIFHDHFSNIVTGEVEGMYELLSVLKQMGFRLYGLTNWCSKVHETIAQYGIFSLLDGMVISSEEHLIKPELAIYERLLRKFGLKAEECLFTDDKQVNIDGAKAVGIDATLFTTAEGYRRELERRIGRHIFCDGNMKWKLRSSENLFNRPWLNVRRDAVELPNGKVYDEYYVLHYPTWINVIAITDKGEFIIERQYRHALGEVSTEICAGCAEEGEDPLTAAKRELQEETGYAGGEWTELMVCSPNSSTMDNRCHCYLAEGVTKISSQALDETEDIKVYLCSRSEVRDMLERGEFKQAMMLAPLWKYFTLRP